MKGRGYVCPFEYFLKLLNEFQLNLVLEVTYNKSWLANVILVHISPVHGFSSLATATSDSSLGYQLFA